jgi:hypothetical protein
MSYKTNKELVFFLVEEEIFFGWIIGPNLFDAVVCFAFIFYLL